MSLTQKLIEIKQAGRLNDAEIATACGVAPATIRMIVLTGEEPRSYRVREHIERFVELNGSVRRRSELRFV